MIFENNLPLNEVIAAAQRPEVVDAMRKFYQQADQSIAEKNATCWNKGDCCRFGQYGHRLYVTALEVAYYVAMGHEHDAPFSPRHAGGDTEIILKLSKPSSALPILQNEFVTADACPHAHDNRCHARERRPLGCRIFYCDPSAQDWQGPMTEERLAQLRSLHETLEVPYFYADWMTVLKALSA